MRWIGDFFGCRSTFPILGSAATCKFQGTGKVEKREMLKLRNSPNKSKIFLMIKISPQSLHEMSSIQAYFSFNFATNYFLSQPMFIRTRVWIEYLQRYILSLPLLESFPFAHSIYPICTFPARQCRFCFGETLRSNMPGRTVFTSPTVACLYL
jgi:hypothetical protein